ncbi:MAG TPA: formate dehydrogenase accessory sulfurtransferase FdhD [Thermomicrobiales bacterium]|nr:formate dehydrogenase accessory sulfurtransferase FdhD [Thermomicrobiales bacterium]
MADRPAHVDCAVTRVRPAERVEDRDRLAVEEPLEIRLVWRDGRHSRRDSIAVTMRTPGADFELAIGFLYGEGIIRSRDDFVDVAYCVEDDGPQTFNIVTVTLSPETGFDLSRLSRHFYTTSSCGVCGKATLEALDILGCDPLPDGAAVAANTISGLPELLFTAQASFHRTGGLHAAGLFSLDGSLLCSREDVGRHNALDKVIGERVMAGDEVMSRSIVMLSGRASFELLQKSLMARIPIVAAVGAPSSLAVDLARSFNITLAGFVRPDGFNLYSGNERVLFGPSAALTGDAEDVVSTR